MKIIYIVRHGQTESNASKTTGRSTDGLSPLGFRQATLIAERFRNVKIEAVISGNLERALQTAEVIAGTKKLPVESSDLFVEVKSPSILHGKSSTDGDVAELYLRRQELWGVRDVYVDDEENFYDADERARKALAFLVDHPAERVVVVSHGAFTKSLVEHVLMGDLLTPEFTVYMYEKIAISNTGITIMKYNEGEWKLLCLNDTVHLDQEHESY